MRKEVTLTCLDRVGKRGRRSENAAAERIEFVQHNLSVVLRPLHAGLLGLVFDRHEHSELNVFQHDIGVNALDLRVF